MAREAGKGYWLGGIGRAFADRNFRIYSIGSIASWISFFVQMVAVAWLTWELTKSTKWLAIMALLDIAPNVVLMPLAGALADRHDRHTIMLATSALSLVQAAALAVPVASFANLKTPARYTPPEPSANPVARDIVEGFAYIWRKSTMLPLLALLLVGEALARGFYTMLPAYSELILGLGVSGVSLIMASGGVGATAALWLAHGGAEAAKIQRILWASIAAMLALAAIIETANVYLAAAIACIMGFASETRRTSTMSIVQVTVDDAQRGRVMGTMFMLTQLAAAVGSYLRGAVAITYGLQIPIRVGVGVGLTVWLAMVFLLRMRR